MTNPFEAFNISDDEEDQFVQSKTTDKVRKTHKERRQFKKQGPNATQTVVNTEVPLNRAKQTGNEHKHKRETGRPEKGVPAGHPLDRRSGTGRQDRPRKQGGGFNNVGNVNDEFKRERYENPKEQGSTQVVTQVPQEEIKPEEPQALTLAEYYQSKGVDISSTGPQRKAPVKGEVNAEWLKKEKLTVLQTKEDKRRQEVVKQNILVHNSTKVENDFGNSELLGFGTRPVQKHSTEEHHHDAKHQKGAKKGPKVALKEDDFPTL